MGYPDSNTFHGLRTVNVRRCEGSFHPVNAWTPAEWMTAVAGEVGEAANLIKKLKRIDTDGLTSPQNRELIGLIPDVERSSDPAVLRKQVEGAIAERIGEEIADVVIYLDLLAARLGIDLGAAVISKFNKTSKKIGSLETLPY